MSSDDKTEYVPKNKGKGKMIEVVDVPDNESKNSKGKESKHYRSEEQFRKQYVAMMTQKVKCACGLSYVRSSIVVHRNSPIHLKYVEVNKHLIPTDDALTEVLDSIPKELLDKYLKRLGIIK